VAVHFADEAFVVTSDFFTIEMAENAEEIDVARARAALAGATGDWIPFLLAAAVCAAALAAVRSQHERAAVLVDGLPGDPARVGPE